MTTFTFIGKPEKEGNKIYGSDRRGAFGTRVWIIRRNHYLALPNRTASLSRREKAGWKSGERARSRFRQRDDALPYMTPSTWKMWRVSDLGRNDGGDEYDGDDQQIGSTFPKLFHKIAQGCQKMFRFWSLCFFEEKFLLGPNREKG